MNKKHPYIFSSKLTAYITGFIEMKRACGYKYGGEERMLQRFDKFLVAENLQRTELPRHIVEKWIERNDTESRRSQINRLSVIRIFANYLRDRGIHAFIPPIIRFVCKSPDFIPYIFTHKQIAVLFKSADALKSSRKNGLAVSYFPVIIRLLYSSGLRISEATHLLWKDVNLETGVIKIRQGKFRKDRIIPLSGQMLKVFKMYADEQENRLQENPLFPGQFGKPIDNRTIYSCYRKALFGAGISHGGRGKGPRLHDLRHTFAVHNLERWLITKQDFGVNLPVLVDYLGHETMEGTQQYLQLIQTMFPEIILRADETIGQQIRQYDNEKN